MANDEVREAMDEDDYDLLTYDEVAVRLRGEIAAQQAVVDAAADAVDAAAAQDRLQALKDASVRTSRRRVNDETFERFFGFPSRAQRTS